MSSGQRKRHDGWNKSIMRDGVIVILRKDGTEKVRLDPKTRETIRIDAAPTVAIIVFSIMLVR